jgi:hypothetical protein
MVSLQTTSFVDPDPNPQGSAMIWQGIWPKLTNEPELQPFKKGFDLFYGLLRLPTLCT